MLKRLVLVSGPVGAGKTTLSEALARTFALHVIKTRALILSMTRTREERADLQVAGERLDRKTRGQWVAMAIQRQIEEFPDESEVLVDSIRIQKQVNAIRAAFGARVFHIHLTAPEPELARRYTARQARSDREMASYAEVRRNRTERAVEDLAGIADVVIDTQRCTPDDVVARVASHLGYYGRGTRRLVDVLVGGQYGSEGKGNIAHYLAPEYDVLVRVGGPNAGHKVHLGERGIYTFHHLPSGTLNTNASLILGAGATLHVPDLLKEIGECKVDWARLSIDPRAMVIEPADRTFEAKTLKKSIASTAQGVGAATARKVMRNKYPGGPPVRLATDVGDLRPFVRETRSILDDAFRSGKRVMLEGTQGTGLSLHHGPYPHVTSRDTTVSGCLADAGIAPSRVRKIVMVCRTYPIRVKNPGRGRTSGPMSQEITYEELAKRSRIPIDELKKTEKTSTTNKQRRVGEFEWALLRKAASLNGPTDIALTFADYLNVSNRDAMRFEQLDQDTIRFIEEVERVTGAPVSLLSKQFGPRAIIDRRKWW
jgi:adenylosuccinate synthase